MRSEADAADRPRLGVSLPVGVALFAAAGLAALLLYAPALRGDFVSDDLNYVTLNPTIAPLDAARVLDILNPWGSAARYIANYAPAQMLIVALQRHALGDDPLGYHVLNVLVHACASVLLGLMSLRAGLPRAAAALVGLLFLVHPANVEGVIWVSQLKTTGGLAFSLLALALFRRRPWAGAAAFALALGFKATAAAALPAALALLALEARRPQPGPRPPQSLRPVAAGLAGWIALFGAYAFIQLGSFSAANAAVAPLHSDPLLRVANLVGLIGRYVGMSVGFGLSTFQQPDALESVWHAWIALGALAIAAIAWRALASWRRGSPEFAAWVFAVAAWAPTSQIFPFTYPIADRYLYFVLAGALPAIALAIHSALRGLQDYSRARVQRAALALGALAVVGGAALAHQRVLVWRSPAFVLADATRHYPDGLTARVMRARAAALRGDAGQTALELRGAIGRGFDGLSQLLQDPAFAPVLGDPRVQTIVHELARSWIAHFEAETRPTQQSLRSLAHAYFVIGERERAIATLERALRQGGSLDAELRARLGELERAAR